MRFVLGLLFVSSAALAGPLSTYWASNRFDARDSVFDRIERLQIKHFGGTVFVLGIDGDAATFQVDDVANFPLGIEPSLIRVTLEKRGPGNYLLTTVPVSATIPVFAPPRRFADAPVGLPEARLVVRLPVRALKHLSVVTGYGDVFASAELPEPHAGNADSVLYLQTGLGAHRCGRWLSNQVWLPWEKPTGAYVPIGDTDALRDLFR